MLDSTECPILVFDLFIVKQCTVQELKINKNEHYREDET